MHRRWPILLAIVFGLAGPAWAAERALKQVKVGTSTVTLTSKSGSLVPGDNAITVSITGSKGQPKSGKVRSLSIFMPAMPGMAEMRADAKLAPARTPGVFTGTLEVDMKGPWKVTIKFEDEKGPHTAKFDVVAK